MNNQPAFPIVIDMGDGVKYQNGMTLRDYMAAKAMQGMFCNDTSFATQWQGQVARDAYAMADAMMKEREA